MKRSKSTTTCEQCGKKFQKEAYDFKRTKHNFCSTKCHGLFQRKRIKKICGNCGKEIIIRKGEHKKSKSGKSFCSKSCAATYNNKLKRKSRRSKIEKKFYNLLIKEFPTLNISANNKTMLDGLEIDVAIPELKLGIEWNGIIHFKPIHGEQKLKNIQEKDAQKQKIASNKDINLIVISDLVSNDDMLKKSI
jgi:endogenous inhibitor of DNA gyrase (YacG/DUF329 family)